MVLLTLSWSVFAQVKCGTEERDLLQSFVRTKLGQESTTILKSDAEKVIQLVQDYQTANPTHKLNSVSILSCTSTVPLRASSPTENPTDVKVKHISKAVARLEEVNLVYKERKLTPELKLAFRECGPEFVAVDQNLRFKMIVEGEPKTASIYDQALQYVKATPDFEKLLNEYAFISVDEAHKQEKNLFALKYGFFQGYRLVVRGVVPCKEETKNPKTGTQTSIK